MSTKSTSSGKKRRAPPTSSPKRATVARAPPRTQDYAAAYQMMNDRRDELRKNRESLNARVGRPGTNAIGVVVRKFPTKQTSNGRDMTKFVALIGHTEPLESGPDILDPTTGALVMTGEYKAENHPTIPCEMVVNPYSIRQLNAWSAMEDVQNGDVVEIKAMRLRCWKPDGKDKISLFLNCDRVEPKGGSGQFGLLYDMMSQADMAVKSVKPPSRLYTDEEIFYLTDLSKKAREGNLNFAEESYMEGVSRYGDFMVVPIVSITQAEFKQGIIDGFMLNAAYDKEEKKDWLWKKDNNASQELCLGVQVFGSMIPNADFSQRKEFFFFIRAYKDQLKSFGVTTTDLWFSVMRHHIPKMELLCMAHVNNVGTSRNKQNQMMLSERDAMQVDQGPSDNKVKDEKFKFMYALQARQVVVDAPKEYKRVGIQVSFEWAVKALGVDPTKRELPYAKGTKDDPPSADVVCMNEFIGDLREFQKKASTFVVFTTYAIDDRDVIPDYVRFMEGMDQKHRDRLATVLLRTRKTDIKKLSKKNKELGTFLDFASKHGEGNESCIFAIMESTDRAARETQTKFRAGIVDRFLGHTATADGQAASRSAKRGRTGARSQVHD